MADLREQQRAEMDALERELEPRCPICGHEWRRHDPADGRCDAPACDQPGVCRCGRDLSWMRVRIAGMSTSALGGKPYKVSSEGSDPIPGSYESFVAVVREDRSEAGEEAETIRTISGEPAPVIAGQWEATPEPGGEGALVAEILNELRRARAKFPGDNVTTLALVEEVGELAKATFEESRERVRKEAVQVATMAMRVVLDGDQTLDAWREAKGLDPLVPGRTHNGGDDA